MYSCKMPSIILRQNSFSSLSFLKNLCVLLFPALRLSCFSSLESMQCFTLKLMFAVRSEIFSNSILCCPLGFLAKGFCRAQLSVLLTAWHLHQKRCWEQIRTVGKLSCGILCLWTFRTDRIFFWPRWSFFVRYR